VPQTKATFDAATLADAVAKAHRIAPTKGAAFDMAAGLCMDVYPAKCEAILKATNLDITYYQRLTITDAKGDPTVWRIPSAVLAGLLASLTLEHTKLVNLIDPGDGAIRVKAGSLTARLSMIGGEFPVIKTFDTAVLSEANEFAQKVAQVAWAAHKDLSTILGGVHIDGDHILACDRQVAAISACKVPVPKPVTAPLWALSAMLRNASDVRLGATDRALHIALDAESQATTRLYEGTYPDVIALRRTNFTGRASVPVKPAVEALQRMLVVARTERMPSVKLTFNIGLVKSLVFDLEVEKGRIQDTIDISGDYDDPFEIMFTPNLLIPAIENSRDESVEFQFGHPDPTKASLSPVRISDTKEYEVLLTPRQP
jgi:DNA polymerase III sliding clamp (beta) subunit (PCNA family)